MSEIIPGALPDRPVKVRTPRHFPLLLLLAPLLIGAFTGWASADMGRDIWRDFRAPADLVPAHDMLEFGGCSRSVVILLDCNISAVPKASTTGKKDIELRFLSFSLNRLPPVEVLRSRSEPTYLTTNVAHIELWNRALLFLVFAVPLIGMTLFVAWRLPMALRAGKAIAAISGKPLEAIVMPAVAIIETRRRDGVLLRTMVTCAWDDRGKWHGYGFDLPPGRSPYVVDAGAKRVVAVRAVGTVAPLAVDSELSTLELSAGEKTAFHEAVAAAVKASDHA